MRLQRILVSLALAIAPAGAATSPEWAVAVMPSGAEFSVEIAADALARRQGYMYRESVGPREGMLFVFDRSDRHGFWMKNCEVALDIVWLDADWRVLQVAEALPPCPADGPCPLAIPMRPARYVLEVAAGNAAREGLVPGSRLVVLSEPALP